MNNFAIFIYPWVLSLLIVGCDQPDKVVPRKVTSPGISYPLSGPTSAVPATSQPQIESNTNPTVSPLSPATSSDPAWEKILKRGFSEKTIPELKSYALQLAKEGKEKEAYALIDSLPLGLLRDHLLLNLFRRASSSLVTSILQPHGNQISDADKKIFIQALLLTGPNENGERPNFLELAKSTTDASLKEDLLLWASASINKPHEWETITESGLSEEALVKAAANSFTKIADTAPTFLRDYAADTKNLPALREEAAKSYSLYLLKESPTAAAAYVEATGSALAAWTMYSYWIKQDPASATNWMKTQAGTKVYRRLVQETINYAEIHQEQDSVEAWQKVFRSLDENP